MPGSARRSTPSPADLDQALDNLRYQWNQTQAQDWVTLAHDRRPDREDGTPIAAMAAIATPASRDEIVVELARLNSGAPVDRRRRDRCQPTHPRRLRRDRSDLAAARGRWSNTPEAHAIRARETWLAEHPAEAEKIRTLEFALFRHNNPTQAIALDRLARARQDAVHRPGLELGL